MDWDFLQLITLRGELKNKHPDQEQQLINQIKQGDMDAFRQIVEQYKEVSLSLAVSILKNKTLAEDVLQEVFIKVFQKIKTFNAKTAFATWLYRIVVNTSYNELKRQKRQLQIDGVSEELMRVSIEQNSILERETQKIYINQALAQLTTNEALILRLFYLGELSIKEIAKVTDFKPSKIKVNLHRGRKNLEFQLKNMLGDEIKYLL